MTDRLTIHAIVDDHGAMSYVHAGRHMSWPSVAEGIRALRHTADDGNREVETVLHHDRGPVQHVVLKPESGADLATQPLMIQIDPEDRQGSPYSTVPPRPQHAPHGPAVQRVLDAAASSTPIQDISTVEQEPTQPVRTGSSWARPATPGTGGPSPTQGRPIEAAAAATAGWSPPPRTPSADDRHPEASTTAGTTAPPRREPSERGRRAGKIMMFAAAAAAAIGIVTAGVLLFQDDMGDSTAQQTSDPSPESDVTQDLTLVEGGSMIPGFTDEEVWEISVPENATSLAFEEGVMVIEGSDLTIYDPFDGTERLHSTIDGEVEFAVETTVGEKPAIVWRIGRTAYALVADRARPIEYQLGSEARLSAAGSAVLISDGSSLSTLGPDGRIDIAAPGEDMIPMAVDGQNLISGRFEGQLSVTDASGAEVSTTTLAAPEDGMAVLRWITAGHGTAVAIWGEPGADISSGHQVQLTTHRIDDGSVISSTPSTTDVVGEEEWHRGQGHELASIGPYVFEMTSGRLVIDGSAQQLDFDSPTGPLAPAQGDAGPVIVAGAEIHPTEVGLLAVIPDGPAIVRSGPDRVIGLPSG